MGGNAWNHPFHCRRPRQGCAPTPHDHPSVTTITVINIINIIASNSNGPVVPSGGTGATGGGGNAKSAQSSKYDAIYLIDLWEKGTFRPSSDEKDWRIQPVAKAIWYFSNADLETMNAGPLPDKEFQVPGNLPNGFDWEGYMIDCQDAAKTMTIRIGIIEGANTVGRDFLLPGDGSCRTVGSAGRYVKDTAFGVVIPIRRDERSTFMTTVKNPDYQKAGKVTTKVQYLEARCRYYISCAPPPKSQIGLVKNVMPSSTEIKKLGHQGFTTFASFANVGAGFEDPAADTGGNTAGSGDNTFVQETAKLVDNDDDVEESPNEDYEQMQGSTVPPGFDAGDGEPWTGKLISDETPQVDSAAQIDTTQTGTAQQSTDSAPQ